MVTAVRFLNGQEAFSLTTAAQNIHVFLRKSPLLKEHFFELLKTAISSNACGTSTLKSPLLRAFSVPDVHPRLRKRPPRCTLDCGFETSESPALRGFVAERCPTTGTSLYLVLKSNGLRHSKNPPVRFSFSLKIVPANIAKKLPPQRCSKSLSSRFPTSRTNGPRSLSLLKSGTHSAFGEGSHTTAHTAKQGRFGWGWYHYPRSVSHGSETLRGQGVERQTLPLLGLGRGCSQRTQRAFGTAMRLCASLSRRRRGPAGPRDLFTFVEIAACTPCAQGLSACAR